MNKSVVSGRKNPKQFELVATSLPELLGTQNDSWFVFINKKNTYSLQKVCKSQPLSFNMLIWVYVARCQPLELITNVLYRVKSIRSSVKLLLPCFRLIPSLDRTQVCCPAVNNALFTRNFSPIKGSLVDPRTRGAEKRWLHLVGYRLDCMRLHEKPEPWSCDCRFSSV